RFSALRCRTKWVVWLFSMPMTPMVVTLLPHSETYPAAAAVESDASRDASDCGDRVARLTTWRTFPRGLRPGPQGPAGAGSTGDGLVGGLLGLLQRLRDRLAAEEHLVEVRLPGLQRRAVVRPARGRDRGLLPLLGEDRGIDVLARPVVRERLLAADHGRQGGAGLAQEAGPLGRSQPAQHGGGCLGVVALGVAAHHHVVHHRHP